MDAAERALLEETVRGGLASASSDGGPADAVLADVGWLEMLEAEPRDAVGIVFGALGATNCTATVLDDVVVSALGLQARADLAVLLPQWGAWAAPGHLEGGRAGGRGITSARAATAADLLVVCTEGTEIRAVIVPAASADVRPVRGVDPEGGLHAAVLEPVAGVDAPIAPTAWESAVAFGRRAVAHQIEGASRTMLTLARDHALARVQFGRPIASFQAVRHRLADALVAIEALDATLRAAGDGPEPLTAALAKATAGRTATTVATHCQQVLAGIGFTTDHPFHRYLKRTMLLDGLLGSADAIAIDVGRQLLAARQVPTLIEL
jgi:Acyl-CoA dehydrogenase, C-terminal domain